MPNNNEPSQEEVLQLIQAKQDDFHEVYFAEFEGYEFLFTEISRRNYKRLIQAFPDPIDLEEAICIQAVFFPVSFDFQSCPGGIPTYLAAEILSKSGFLQNGIEEIIQRNRETFQEYEAEMGELENQIAVIIVHAFPAYKLEDVEGWPISKALWFLSRAQFLLQLRGEPIEIKGLSADAKPPRKQPLRQQERKPETPIVADHSADHMPQPGKFEVEGNPDMMSFGELAQIDRFMKGKL